MRVLMIVPAYNEEASIVKTVNSIRQYAIQCTNFILDYIVINDGSTDNTKKICKENNIKCLTLYHNLGIGGAVQSGYIFALKQNYDIAVQFDGDGQHDINSLEKLIQPIINEECDFVIGSRFVNGTSTFKSTIPRRIGIKHLSFIIKLLCHKKITDPTSGFRAANKKVLNVFAKEYPIDYPEPESIVYLNKNKIRIKEVQVNMFERVEGKSSINVMRAIYYMIKVTLAMFCSTFQKRTVNK